MDKTLRRSPSHRRTQVSALALLTGLALVSATLLGQGRGGGQGPAGGPAIPLDQARELAMKINTPFTLAAVGDIMQMHGGLAQLADPAVQGAIKIIRGADVAFANMESNIADIRHFQSPVGTGGLVGPKEVAADVKAMGFDMVNRGNNVAMRSGAEGVLSTNKLLDEVGVVHAGAGKNLQEARDVAYFQSPKGRIGLVGMLAGGADAAVEQFGNFSGATGVAPLRLTRTAIVTAAQLEALRSIRDAAYQNRTGLIFPVPAIAPNEPKDRLQLFGESYKLGTRTGDYSYTMNQDDLRAVLRSIRNGKQYSDFMIATIHSLEPPNALTLGNLSEFPADFMIDLAHQAIDNGADAFIGHGVHVLRGLEVYKGKPIFYGLHTFVYQLNQGLVGLNTYGQENPFRTEVTDAEFEWRSTATYGRPRMSQDNLESVVAECKYDGGHLVEVRLYPLDMGIDAPMSQKGIPRIASPAVAARTLKKLQALSKPFGTTITIDGNVGVVRVPTTATASVR